ncbi:MAG: hypothetical protein P8Y70_12820 [Candidatus Lokiarchaeota archaeon]
MVKCPFCKEDLELGLEIKPTKIDDKFKDDAMVAIESFIDIQAEAAPFGGKIVKSMSKFSLKWIKRYFDEIGAIPIIIQYCKNCESVINTEILIKPVPNYGQNR